MLYYRHLTLFWRFLCTDKPINPWNHQYIKWIIIITKSLYFWLDLSRSFTLCFSAKSNNLTQNYPSLTHWRTLHVYTACFLYINTHVHVSIRALMPACVYVHWCLCVCACVRVHSGAAGVSLAEDTDKSQTTFPPAISLGTLRASICISKEKALLDWPWNQ